MRVLGDREAAFPPRVLGLCKGGLAMGPVWRGVASLQARLAGPASVAIAMGRKRSLSDKLEKAKDNEFRSASFRELLRYAETADYLLLTGGVLGSIATGCINPLTAYFMGFMNTIMINCGNDIRDGTVDFDRVIDDVNGVSLNLGVVFLSLLCFSYFSMVCFYCLCERQVHRIRKRFLFAVMHKDMEWFDVNPVGALTQKMSSGVDRIKDGMSDKIGVVCHAVVSLISGIIIAFSMNWKMALVMLIVAPCVTISLIISARVMRKAVRSEMTAYSIAGAVASEVLSGIRTVMSFNAQEFEVQRYKQHLKDARREGIRKAAVTGGFTGIFTFFMNTSMGIGFYFGTTLVFSGEMMSGQVFGVFWAIMLGAMRIGQAVPNMNAIIAAKMAAGEIFAIIDQETRFDCSTDSGVKLESVRGDISFRDIHFAYPTRPTVKVLNGVSFNVEAGQKVAFVGHSGCGKSTTIGLLMRFYAALSGSITLDDVPLDDLNVSWLRETFGLVSQEPVLFAASIEDNLKLGQDFSQEAMENACRTANALDFIQQLPLGFQTQIGEGGVRLSGGQKQRIAIARALIRNPKVLLLDEATSALDTESERLVQDALDCAAQGRTTISIAHRLSTIRNADVIVVFDKGVIAEVGNHDSLLAKEGLYAQLVAAQQIAQEKDSDDDFETADEREPNERLRTLSNALEARDSARRARASERFRKSMTNTEEAPADVLDIEEEVHEEGAARASILDILRFSKKELKLVIGGVLGAVLTGARFPVYSMLVTRFFYALGMTDDPDAGRVMAFWTSIAFVITGLVSGMTCFMGGMMLGTAGERMSSRLRIAVFRNILRQDGYYFDQPNHSIGKLAARLATDAHNVQAAIDQRLSEVLQGLTSLVGGLIVAFGFGPAVAPVCLITSLILVTVQLSLTAYLKRRGIKDIQVAEEASRIASEAIENIRTVQALARQKSFFNSFCVASNRPHKRVLVRGFFQSSIYSLALSFSAMNFAVSYSLGVLLVRSGWSTPAVLFQVVEALNIASLVIIATSSYFPEYLKARLSAGLMFQMMHENPRIDGSADSGLTPALDGTVSFQKVAFTYPNRGRHLVLNGLSLHAPAGKTIALVGPSGCGKSTTFQLIERFYDALAGQVCLDKFDTKQLNVQWARGVTAVVGQEPTLFNLTIGENIAYGLAQPKFADIENAARLANIHEFVRSLPQGYETVIGSKGTQLSGGQRQRLAIARAMMRNPKVLLLDEATSALDTESEKVVQEALEKAREGRTCLVIAHRLSTVQHADQIVVMREGRVAEIGSHQQLLARRGLYYRMVQKQQMG